MFKLLRRIFGKKMEPEHPRAVNSEMLSREDSLDIGDVAVLPQVVEGNSVSDWELWEESVHSQMQPLGDNVGPSWQTRPGALEKLDRPARDDQKGASNGSRGSP